MILLDLVTKREEEGEEEGRGGMLIMPVYLVVLSMEIMIIMTSLTILMTMMMNKPRQIRNMHCNNLTLIMN